MSFVDKTHFPSINLMQLIINYPTLLPDALQETPAEFEQQAKMAMAAKLFEMGKLSSGMAANLIGIERVEFLLNLHHYNIPMINLDTAELDSDTKNA